MKVYGGGLNQAPVSCDSLINWPKFAILYGEGGIFVMGKNWLCRLENMTDKTAITWNLPPFIPTVVNKARERL